MSSINQYKGILDKYISGGLTPEERFWIEKKALDDPLLFDAIEGYNTHLSTKHDQNIRNLQSRVIAYRQRRFKRNIIKTEELFHDIEVNPCP